MSDHHQIQSHRDLKVWHLGMKIAEQLYQITHEFPAEERFGLTSQIRRAAVSVPANIAEGNARASVKEYLRFLSISIGSLAELDTLLDLAHRFNYGNLHDIRSVMQLMVEERRMLYGLQRSLRTKLTSDLSEL